MDGLHTILMLVVICFQATIYFQLRSLNGKMGK